MAPTDAALGQPVITDQRVPARIRRILNVESGLNDGIATPFVYLALALAAAEESGSEVSIGGAVAEGLIGAVAGIVVGGVGGWLLLVADRRAWTSPASRQLAVLALSIGSYLVAIALGGNGFIAAFVGGLAFGVVTRQRAEDAVEFTEAQGSLLAIVVWTIFGITVGGSLIADGLDLPAIAYAILSLTVVRMVPVALALVGCRFQPATVAFIGWFGPRGLASIVFAIILLEEGGLPHDDTILLAVFFTIGLSVLAHGVSAAPLADRYARWFESNPDSKPL